MKLERVPIDSLRPHPHNYRKHPETQVAEIVASLEQYGQYRALVISQDDVILAGEGVWRGLIAKGATEAEVCRMPFAHTDPRAKKLLVLDNTITRLSEDDDTQLAALLAEVQQTEGLEGTGYDDAALDALIAEVAFDPASVPTREFDENLDLSGIKKVTCPECGHEFPL